MTQNTLGRNIVAVIAGIIVGSIVNITLINVSGYIIPPPEGADIKTMEGLKETMHLFQPRHFLFPFLAHAFGTLAGAYVAARIAATKKMIFAIVLGIFFLSGGIANVVMLPSPLWYTIVDLAGAYLPMGYLGGKIAVRKSVVKI